MSELFEALKQGTADLHEEIEKWMPNFGQGFSRDAYRSHLRCVYGFYQPVEAQVKTYLANHGDPLQMKARFKLEKLRQDLQQLGDDPAGIDKIVLFKGKLEIETTAQLIGCVYVLEGSTLGGQLIKRSLKTNLGLDDNEMNFYRGYDSETGPMWKAFRQKAIEVANPADTAASVATARSTFQAYTDWLRQAGMTSKS